MNKLTSLILSLAFISLLSCSSCKDPVEIDVVGDLEINFKAKFDEQPLVMFTDYTYPESTLDFRLQKFQFYISDITLIHEDGTSETLLSEIELINFTDHVNETLASAGTSRLYPSIPTGIYKGIKMGIGVSSELNERNTEYPLDHILGMNFWEGWASFIFAKLEGNMDTDQSGTFDNETAERFLLHTGSNSVYQTVTFVEPITISENNNYIPTISVDIKDLLINNEGTVYDIINNNTTHDPNDLDSGLFLMRNFERAMTFE